MGKYAQKADALHQEKYNCCQSVVLAFAEELGLDEATLAKLTANFGGGMGYAGEVCGAISGMAVVSGALGPWKEIKDKDGKMQSYDCIKELVAEFQKTCGNTRCPALKAMQEEGGKSCTELIQIAADMVAKKMGLAER